MYWIPPFFSGLFHNLKQQRKMLSFLSCKIPLQKPKVNLKLTTTASTVWENLTEVAEDYQGSKIWIGINKVFGNKLPNQPN